ncbi:lipid asymmetry maintenance protein MlaB [Kosakonia oryziphila]|uniref:Phospholipid transport system transporter-binding protein n=1 Tax=Kosakonia oryziphila TaxID=1005667 RepID=A0A1C4EJE4_9ENTR|nr:lipid asymmetry maintenance protein MlaB [Kosakonia oryziphila]SCC43674.1 phospholipid transport system transporter-binding protein [Kosakonia oryziphila]
MTPQLSWSREGESLMLQGELDQDVLDPLYNARVEAMKGVTCINLQGVTRVDTAGVALLIHLIAEGKNQGAAISLAGMSDSVATLAALYNLPGDVLPR